MSAADGASRRVPRSTYRLQLSAAFPLDAAAEVADYLHDLGADWLYLSPLLAATPGSTHAYDVVEPGRVDPERGGEAGLERLAAEASRLGMGVLVDIVPNHMGVGRPETNAWWWDVLRNGRASDWARHFDIDWEFGGGRVRIPVLGEPIEDAAASGALRLEDGELRYHEHRFPLTGGTEELSDPLDAHALQHYELVHWARADAELNYRRFFAVNELAGLRVEDPVVFEDTHREILRWMRDGLVDGIRVDHPDGLAQPGGYLDRLRTATGGAYTVVEKILEHGELLPAHWAADGTTGYDALAEVDRVLVDPAGAVELGALDERLRGDGSDWADLVHDAKREVADGILRSEVLRLVRDFEAEAPPIDELPSATDDLEADRTAIADAIAELLACFPVYRSYLPHGAEHLERALDEARQRRPEFGAELDAIADALRDPDRAVAVRFQQTSGAVMAKGVEDRAFYRVARLTSLSEVGGSPRDFALDLAGFHAAQQARLATLPHSMTALSTHDTKRGEDTRARIAVLAEIPEEWAAFMERRHAALPIGDGAVEHLLWQSIVGSWPREREALHGYAEKAAREAGTSTSWARPDEDFEARMHELVDSAFDDETTRADLEAIVARIERAGWSNGLAAKLLQLSGPGVPDVYQGSELWERSLVDPDNRRPVDYVARRAALAALDAGELPELGEDGLAKLLVTSRVLRARRDRPEWFERYVPLTVLGHAADHAIAVERGGAIVLATRLPIGLERLGGWGETRVLLPSRAYRDAFTGARFDGGALRLGDALARYPVALLLAETTEAP